MIDAPALHPPGPDHEGPFMALPCCPCTYLDRNHAVCNERGFWHHPDCAEPFDKGDE